MRPAQLPQFLTTTLAVAPGAATAIENVRVQTGMYGYTSPAALTLSLAIVAVAIGVVVAAWWISAEDARRAK